MCHMDTWEIFDGQQNVFFCYQKDCTSSRSVSMHLYMSYDVSRAHRSGRSDKQNILACHHKAYGTLRKVYMHLKLFK